MRGPETASDARRTKRTAALQLKPSTAAACSAADAIVAVTTSRAPLFAADGGGRKPRLRDAHRRAGQGGIIPESVSSNARGTATSHGARGIRPSWVPLHIHLKTANSVDVTARVLDRHMTGDPVPSQSAVDGIACSTGRPMSAQCATCRLKDCQRRGRRRGRSLERDPLLYDWPTLGEGCVGCLLA
jgi:hypothetical protein